MRRMLLLLCAVLLVGCAKTEQPADHSATTEEPNALAALTLAAVAGVWEGTVTAAGSDSVLANLVLTATPDATGWTMMVANAADPSQTATAPANSVVASGDSIVVETGPFGSVLRPGQQVNTHSVYRLQDGALHGTIQATYPATGESVMLQTHATKRAG